MNSIEEAYDFICDINDDSNMNLTYQKSLKLAEWLLKREKEKSKKRINEKEI